MASVADCHRRCYLCCVIYFVRAGGSVKIGCAGDVQKRMRELQTGNPYTLELLLTLPGSQEEEFTLHQQFAADLIRGEWFQLSRAMQQFLWDHGYRDIPPPVISISEIRGTIHSFDWRPKGLRTLVEALVEGTTTIAPLDEPPDPCDETLLQIIHLFLKTEVDPTEEDALQRLYWFYFAPPSAYARLRRDPDLARLNDVMRKSGIAEIGPRV